MDSERGSAFAFLRGLQATRWRFLHHGLTALGAAFGVLLVVTLVWAIIRWLRADT